MMTFKLFLLIMNIGLIINIDAKIIFNTCTDTLCEPEDPDKNFEHWDYQLEKETLYVKIFEERKTPTPVAIINCANCDDKNEPKIGSFQIGDPIFLEMKIEKLEQKQYILQILNRQDYENKNQREYNFKLILPNMDDEDPIALNMDMRIIDIDDVAPSIIAINTPCIIEENMSGKSDCTFKIEDPDSTDVTYEVADFSDIFNVIDDENPLVKPVNKIARLYVLKELDFETQPMYSFKINAFDNVRNLGTTLVIIKVKDVSDTPPVWIKIFATKSFKEHDSTQKYYVSAKDGDIEVNAPISYKFDDKCHKEITVNNENGEILIGDIDRDKPEIEDNTIKCTIIAYEDEEIGNGDSTESEIIFIVQDINDNIPEITLKEEDICMNEGETTQFNNIFSVNDIDQGANAQYDVSLVDDDKYSKAFQIIPSSGYRSWDFSITVINANLLDYDNKEWRNFELEIYAIDKGIPPMEDKKKINVCLYNMNNNAPVFTSDDEVEIPENVKANHKIIDILATDKDTDDHVTYKITMGEDKFEFKNGPTINDPITVYTKKDNVFDYEKQKEVFFQITVNDNLNSSNGIKHTVSQQITITVTDINDEKPRITLLSSETPEIKEHSKNYKIEDILEAEDVDTTANLEFSIIWEETYAMKEGSKKTNKTLFENVFDIVPKFESFEDGTTNYGKAKASLVVNDAKKLDWEEFEILYLKIKVEDTEQVENKPGIDVALMAIIILDINDNPPILNTPSDKFKVIEKADGNINIGFVLATDKDGPGNNEILYELTPIDGTKDFLIKIDEKSGEITVNQSNKIDADCPKTWNLSYNVTAKDPVIADFKDTKTLYIAIEDINNKYPRLETKLKPVDFEEGKISEKNAPITKIEAVDDDRDKPHNELIYEINGEANTELVDYFEINEKGNVFVKKPLLWTKEKQNIQVNIIIKDNKGLAGFLSLKEKFTLNIIDVDNNAPILPKDVNFSPITEAEEKEKHFAKIIATDADKPCTPATEIEYKITKIMNVDKNIEIKDEIFRIDTDHESDKNDCIYYGNVVINKDLTEHYGKFTITVTATNPVSKNKDEKDYDLVVTPFNFREPSITNPENQKIILRTEQELDDTLIQIDNNLLNDFKATDNQGDKFLMKFSLEAIEGDDIFKFKSMGKSAAQLQLKKQPDTEQFIYKIKVKAKHSGTGNSASEVEKSYDVYFLDRNQSPYFDKNNYTLQIKENDESFCSDFPKASDPKCSINIRKDCEFITFYHILYKTEYFHIPDPNIPNICVKKPLDYEEQTLHELTIVASNYPTAPSQEEPKSSLKLTVFVEDVNDNPPVFDSKSYLGGMTSGLTVNTEILTVFATDIDTVDKDALRYKIVEESIYIGDKSLETIKNKPFDIDSKTGVIRNNFSPVVDMKGYILFDVIVFDSGELHSDTAEVKISIITEANKIAFSFNNDVDLVKARRIQVSNIFTNELQYNCSIDGINKKTNSGVVVDNQTEVVTHFINPDNNEPVAGSNISSQTGEFEVFSRLSLRFDDIGLELSGIKKNAEEQIENMENLLRTLLIVVSVVLSALIIILIIAFILRTRSLKKRLASMTDNIFGSTKSDLNRIGASAPGTNRHAVEANPVWNTDLKSGTQFDSISQTSGGSDLIGIEDNPEFEYNQKDSLNPMANMSFVNDDDDINSLPGSNI